MVLLDGSRGLEIHAAHAAHAAAGRHRRLVLLRGLGHHRFGGDHQARDRRGVLQRGAGDLGRVQDAELDHVAELAVGGVVAERTRTFDHAVEDDRRLIAGIGHDLAQRGFHRAQGDLDAVVLVFVHALDAGDRRLGTDQGDAAARDDAFLDGRTGRVQASSTRAFFSFISTSVAAPTLITATPPASLATRLAASRGRSRRRSPRSAP